MRLLVAEDDRFVAEFIRYGMQEEGYAVDIAHDGEDARALAMVHDYDVVLLDLQMPRLSGIDVARMLRDDGRNTPILMLTARGSKHDIIQGLDAGADDYLTKPFDMQELKARVRALMRRGGARRTDNLVLGTLTLDMAARRVRNGKVRIKLTPTEYRILECFMLRPEQVVTRTEFMEKVWDLNFDPGTNVVEVHVARLRSKLRALAVQPQIVTVRSAGYALTMDPASFTD
jgi:DNA-binding response OmpR family regulator